MAKYNHKEIEKKWQKKWNKDELYRVGEDAKKPKYYILDMFPYPSGEGLHVGHPKGYIATDIFARMKMMQGHNVLHPMGWDAFGLPAENYAIKNKVHPRVATEKNIATFKSQIEKLGMTYDWDREIDTTDPEYYKWTQWCFLKMFERGLAFESHEPINWCPGCQTGLANEDLEDGRCERCDSEIEQKPMRQWVLKITDYADRMLEDLDKLPEWSNSIREMQRNWIGRSEGAIIKFDLKSESDHNSQFSTLNSNVEVFTTRVDTIFGCTYMVVAPENPVISDQKSVISNYDEVQEYIDASKKKTELERTELQKDKTGVEIKGIKAVNPFNGEEIPVFVADYVLGHYGTGAVMAVPAHDERDAEFAKKYDLPIKQSVAQTFNGEGKNKVQKDKPMTERKTVDVILKHWEKDEYFCLDWKINNWKAFIVGGVEGEETLEEAALREAQEESGYKNMKVIGTVGQEIHSNFYAAHKQVNRNPVMRNCVYIELQDGERGELEEEHTKHHDGVWVKKDEVQDFLNLSEPKIYFDILQNGEKAFTEDGTLIDSGEFSGLKSEEAREKMVAWLEKKKLGGKKVNYKLKDWVFSRQRYWGEPIPIVHCEKCGVVGVPESELPVKLPEVKHYEPSGTGESPLATIEDWVNTKCPKCGGDAKRETNTMPQWAGSSWYYLRYIDPKNDNALVDKDKEKYWSPVDFYVGGAEHATRHLIYARFWHKFLFDIGVVNYEEPFTRLQHVGLIMAEDGRKMSKRWGNVINPDDIVEVYGADALRVYEMFMGPFSQSTAWSTKGLTGAKKFLERTWRLFEEKELIDCGGDCKDIPKELPVLLHKTIKKVSEDIEGFDFNTAISQMMIFVNEATKHERLPKEGMKKFLQLLAPFAPHMAEEIWREKLGEKESVFKSTWPKYNPKKIVEEKVEIVIQVNGKVRDKIEMDAEIDEDGAKAAALESENVQKHIEGKEIRKVIFVPGKLISFVV
ncbi:MAG: class I tRNA ligase family protein [Candidatus Moranbacteria bacterium]|nr:class I tRNA ligase family protein [Candidatus Moranbacteria bacterium]